MKVLKQCQKAVEESKPDWERAALTLTPRPEERETRPRTLGAGKV